MSRSSSDAPDQTRARAVPLGDNAGVHIPSDPPPSPGEDVAIDFTGYLLSLSTSCLVSLGRVPHPETGELERDVSAARQIIQILTLLQAKTRGNLEPEEERLLSTLLYDLRLACLEAQKT